MVKLGVNVDHVATVRQARGGAEPCPVEAALEAVRGGAHSITMHLREDRRHIQDYDIYQAKRKLKVPLNLEMAAVPEIIRIALKIRPEKVCFVPERRREITTEGGVNVAAKEKLLKKIITAFKRKKIEVSLFIAPSKKQMDASKRAGTYAVEIHTGTYANARGAAKKRELKKILAAALYARKLGLKVNAGHGLNYENVKPIAEIPQMGELNIGHSIVSRALTVGMREAVRQMNRLIR